MGSVIAAVIIALTMTSIIDTLGVRIFKSINRLAKAQEDANKVARRRIAWLSEKAK